jgi:hypothetical protein
VGPYLIRGIWFPIRLPLEGRIQICWPIADDPWYRGYKTQTVAHDPSVEWVVRAVHSMGGKIGTHISLWVPSQNSVVRPWGWSLHGRDSESCSATHHVAPEAMDELKVPYVLLWFALMTYEAPGSLWLLEGCAAWAQTPSLCVSVTQRG